MTTWIGCVEALPADPDAGPEPAAPQGSLARGDLVINEIAPQPTSGPDWVELYNRSDQAVDLCGYFLTDSMTRLDHYAPLGGVMPPDPCTPVLLAPGAYLVVEADGRAGDGQAPFKLGIADEVHVVTTAGIATDSLVYLYPRGGAGASLARQPDGAGPFYLSEPSAGAPNPAAGAEVWP